MSDKKRVGPRTPPTKEGDGVTLMQSPSASLLSAFDIYEDVMARDFVPPQQCDHLEEKIQSLTQQLHAEQKLRNDIEEKCATIQANHKKAIKELHTCLVAARKSEALKNDELIRVKAEKVAPPCCHNCMAVMDKPENIPKPRQVKVLGAKNCVEVYFSNYTRMQKWCRGYGLITNTDGLPVLPEDLCKQEQLRQAKCLQDVDSLLPKGVPDPATVAVQAKPPVMSKSATGNRKQTRTHKAESKTEISGCNAIPLGSANASSAVPKHNPTNQLSHESSHVSHKDECKAGIPSDAGAFPHQAVPSVSSTHIPTPVFDNSFKIPKKIVKPAVCCTPKKHAHSPRSSGIVRCESKAAHVRARSIVRNARRPTPSPAVMMEQRQRLIREYSVEPSMHQSGHRGREEHNKERECRKRHSRGEGSSRHRSNTRHRSRSPPRKIRRDDDYNTTRAKDTGRKHSTRHKDRHTNKTTSQDKTKRSGIGDRRGESFERRKMEDDRLQNKRRHEGERDTSYGKRLRDEKDRQRHKTHKSSKETHRKSSQSKERLQSRSRSPRKSQSRNRTSSPKHKAIEQFDEAAQVSRSKRSSDVYESEIQDELIGVDNEQVELSPQMPMDLHLSAFDKLHQLNAPLVHGQLEEGELDDECASVHAAINSHPTPSQSPNTSHVSQVSLQLSPNESRPCSHGSSDRQTASYTNVVAANNKSISQEQVVNDETLGRGLCIQLHSPGSDAEGAGVDIRVINHDERHELTPNKTPPITTHKPSPFKLVLNSELTQSSCDDVVKSVLKERKESSTRTDFSHLIAKERCRGTDTILREMIYVAPFLSPIAHKPRVPPLEAAIDDIESWSVIRDVPLPHHRQDRHVPTIRLKRTSDCSRTSASSSEGQIKSPVKTAPIKQSRCKQIAEYVCLAPAKLSPIKTPVPQVKRIARPVGSKLKAMQALMASDAAKHESVASNTRQSAKKRDTKTQPSAASSTPSSKLTILKQLWNKK